MPLVDCVFITYMTTALTYILYIELFDQMLTQMILDNNPIINLTSRLVSKISLLSDISNYLRGLLFNKPDLNLEKLLFLIGTTAITLQAVSFIMKMIKSWSWLPKHFINAGSLSASKMKERYGDCYVCVTGFTEGIGRGYSQIFAQMGFNLLLIGISKEEVQKKATELSKIYKNIKIVSLWADFSKQNEMEDLEKRLAQLQIDVGIVVNNAGTISGGPYLEIKPEDTLRDIEVDLLAAIAIMKVMVPQLRTRAKRSAIINMASIGAVYLFPRLGVYSSVKKSLDNVSRILSLENSDKVDIISVRPFGVSTRMSLMMKGAFVLTPRQCAFGVLRDLLGGQISTSSDFSHKAVTSLMFEHLDEQECFRFLDKLQGEKGLKK